MREVCTVWPGECICVPGAIEENRTYIFELRNPPDPLKAHLFIDDQRLKRDIVDTPIRVQWEWKVEFHAGEVEILIQLTSPGSAIRRILITDPDRRKLTREQFDIMVHQILSDTFALLSFSSYKFRVSSGNTSQFPAIARLEFLRSQFEKLETVIRAIDKSPVRVLHSTMDAVPLHKAREITPPELIKSFAKGRILQAPEARDRLPRALEGRVPEKIYKARKILGLDIREHRDMKAALKSWSSWLSLIADLLAQRDTEDRELSIQRKKWAIRCRAMLRRLDALLKLPLFDEVQDTRQPIYATQIYQRIPLYGQFLSIYSNFQKGIANITGDFLQVPLARTYDLYELWAFLRIARAASIMFPDPEFRAESLFAMDRGAIVISPSQVCFDFGEQLRLCFQRTYREFWIERDGRGTYSRYMRPDFALETPPQVESLQDSRQRILIVLDAKYRVETGLNDALSSIHMYRDALVCQDGDAESDIKRIVTGAYLLTPDIYPVDTEWKDSKMPARLFHPNYRGNFRFGAVTMCPGMKDEEIISLLNTVIADCGGRSTTPGSTTSADSNTD
jgi:predicted component of viral defense system (DUF524 family)